MTPALLLLLFTQQGTPAPTELQRGIGGLVPLPGGAPLRPRSDATRNAPVFLRVIQGRDGGASAEVIALRDGSFDLRDYLEHTDGSPTLDLPPLPVHVTSVLDPAITDLSLTRAELPALDPRYTKRLFALAGAWSLGTVGFLAWQRFRRRTPRPAPIPPPISDLQRLRDILLQLEARDLRIEERARLELLLYRSLALTLGVPEQDPAAIVRALRIDPRAAELLGAVEHWLHARSGQPEPLDRATATLLLTLRYELDLRQETTAGAAP